MKKLKIISKLLSLGLVVGLLFGFSHVNALYFPGYFTGIQQQSDYNYYYSDLQRRIRDNNNDLERLQKTKRSQLDSELAVQIQRKEDWNDCLYRCFSWEDSRGIRAALKVVEDDIREIRRQINNNESDIRTCLDRRVALDGELAALQDYWARVNAPVVYPVPVTVPMYPVYYEPVYYEIVY